MMKPPTRHFLLPVFFLLFSHVLYSQDTTSSDGLLLEARKAVFDNNEYPRAKAYLQKALVLSPDYADVKILLGRIYTWTKNYDSGRIYFKQVLASSPGHEDASVAYTDLEYYTDHFEKALEICRGGLAKKQTSEELLLREARILNAMGRTSLAEVSLQKLLAVNPGNKLAKDLYQSIQDGKIKQAPATTKTANTVAEDSTSSDGLLVLARKAAFDEKNYELAKFRLYKALQLSPDYKDVKVFLGRIHTWTKQYDSARYYLGSVLRADASYEDAAVALADLEYWNDNNETSLKILNEALVSHPESEDLLVRKARVLNAMRRYREAQDAVDHALKIDHNNTEARSLANRIKESSSLNKIGLSYDYVYFDKQFSDPWHLVSFDYTRTTGIGSITGRVNYANRFKEDGVQYELEAYPRISKTFYSYVGLGYSDNVGVFPHWRAGFSLYANLPKSFEGELGVRYLNFSGDPTFIYTAYLGKYYKSWLFSGRTYVTPSNFTNTVSASYSVAARYYYGSADDLVGATIGYGISPDDRQNSIQLDNTIRLITYKAGLSFKKKIKRFSVISFDASWFNQEYLPQTKGNQYQFSIGWLQRF